MEPVKITLCGVAEWNQPDWIRFERPVHILATRSLSEVRTILRQVEEATQKGLWAVGFVAYEAAPAFDPALQTHCPGPLPLIWFALYEQWQSAPEPDAAPPPLQLSPALDEPSYICKLNTIKDCIARGETYQVNFTFPFHGSDPADPSARFAALHRAQHSRYSAFIETSDFAICSASPELFFLQTGDHLLCQPMKGTAPRGRCAEEDHALAEQLKASPKERAENVMIVDMMRNDLGRIARLESVRVSRLFELERLPTVWQMTSSVEARTTAGLDAVFGALFPCASVTGAPKAKTMEIIRNLESTPRGIYTGAIGLAGPGRRARFNVAIRTLTIEKRTADATYNVGSGVIWDSEPRREYAECLAKALVLKAPEEFSVLTSLRWEPGTGYFLWPRHLARIARAARHFGFPFDAKALEEKANNAAAEFPATPQRVRILVDRRGEIVVERHALPSVSSNPTRIARAAAAINSDSVFLYHKTTRREVYERARASRPEADDVLLWNQAGEVTETTIANLAIQRNGRWVTPPAHTGLLAGVMREELLARGEWTEGPVRDAELTPGMEIQLANAVRGRWSARLID